MSTDNHPDVWKVQFRRGHTAYKTCGPIGQYTNAGAALKFYGSIHLLKDTSKRLLKNGKVIDRETGPSPRRRPQEMPSGAVYEHGVLTSLAQSEADILEVGDHDEALRVSVQVKRMRMFKATTVQRAPDIDNTWRDSTGKRADLIIKEWSRT